MPSAGACWAWAAGAPARANTHSQAVNKSTAVAASRDRRVGIMAVPPPEACPYSILVREDAPCTMLNDRGAHVKRRGVPGYSCNENTARETPRSEERRVG